MSEKYQAILIISPLVAAKTSYLYWSKADYKVIAFLHKHFLDNEALKDYIDSPPFDEIILSTENLQDDIQLILDKQKVYDLVWGYIGAESNVAYGEKLLYAIFPTLSNNPHTALWRYSKYAMNERLKEVGLPYITQCKIINKEITKEVDLFLHKTSYPVVVKPNFNSAASEEVHFCNNYETALDYIQKINQHGLLGPISEIIIQEKIMGTEYFADLVSFKGTHVLANIYTYKKMIINDSVIYQTLDSLPKYDPLYMVLSEYAQKILTTLEMRNGFSHIEMMLTLAGEIKLIELNPRPSGLSGFINDVTIAHLNENQYTHATHLLQNTKPHVRSDDKFYCIFFLNNFGFTYSHFKDELLKKIPSYQEHKLLKPVCIEKPTKNLLLDSVALIHLANISRIRLLEDIEILEEYQQKGVLFAP